MQTCIGSLGALPAFLDLPPARVVATMTKASARYEFHLPTERRSPRAMIRRARARIAGSALFDELVRAQDEAANAYLAMVRAQEDFRGMLERAPICATIQRAGRYAWVNPAFARVLGYASPAQLIGRALIDDAHPEELAAVMERLGSPPSTSQRAEFRVRRRDGSFAVLEVASTLKVEFEGAPARLLLARDVTDERRIREQLALADRMTTMGVLAAGVGHELNNPLTYVQLNLERLSREAGSSELRAGLAGALEGVERMRAIVEDLRTLARSDEEVLEAVDLGAAIASTLRLAANTGGGVATVEREGPDSVFVRASRARLGQVLLNLIINAYQAIEERGAEGLVRVRTKIVEDRVIIEISDNGVGIRAADVPRLFEPFFTTKTASRGTGLGLAICHQLVHRFGGTLTAESDPDAAGLRTTMRVALPAAEAPAQPGRPPRGPRARRRILIVDDEPAITKALHLVLSPNHDVLVASGGRAALHAPRARSLLRRHPLRHCHARRRRDSGVRARARARSGSAGRLRVHDGRRIQRPRAGVPRGVQEPTPREAVRPRDRLRDDRRPLVMQARGSGERARRRGPPCAARPRPPRPRRRGD